MQSAAEMALSALRMQLWMLWITTVTGFRAYVPLPMPFANIHERQCRNCIDFNNYNCIGTQHSCLYGAAEALQDPDRCIGKTFAVKSEMVSAGELSDMISQATGRKLVFHCTSDEKARSLPFPGAVAFANMFTFWRESTEAQQQMAELPTLGQSELPQVWVEQHKEEFSRVLANARPVPGG